MNGIAVELLIVLVLLLANGVFAMTEIAVVSARRGRLRRLADDGDAGAQAALDLAESPNRFLATVQIGITLVGVLAGAFGGATIAESVEPLLARSELLAPFAGQIAFGLVVAVITYCSLVLGELVPKRIGLGHPEAIAMAMARAMNRVSRWCGPLVWFLGFSTDTVLRLVGVRPKGDPGVSEDEVRVLMQEGLRAGAFHQVEHEMVSSILDLDQLRVHDLMTPRPKVIFLNRDDTHEQIWHKIVVGGHSYYPVYDGTRDNIVGIVSLKSIYANLAAGVQVNLKDLVVKPLIVPESLNALLLLENFRKSRTHQALVADEFGSVVGMVTLNDVMEAIVGDIATAEERARPSATRREDGSWLADGAMDIDGVAAVIPGVQFTHSLEFQTLAGYVVKQLGHVPREGEFFKAQNYVWEVLDMDRHRVDKVLITPADRFRPPSAGAAPVTAGG
ncbi:MAG TPA: hypothetical protein DCY13_15085 [Verrucomicrobiales bacterium]|nr:hypothetical protein [Verrucomicrobiales bacterium]